MLSSPFITIKDDLTAATYYGGNQAWFSGKTAKDYGCGVIAFANCVLTKESKEKTISKKEYMELADNLRKKYFPIIPGFGINGIELAVGANLFFRKHKMPYRARWGVMPGNLWHSVSRMLKKGWPVLLAIGPNNNLLTGKKAVHMSGAKDDFAMAHYVTITDMDERTITVSSWGNKYTIDKKEYETYMKKVSNPLFSNILFIK